MLLIKRVFHHSTKFPSRRNPSPPKPIIICLVCIMLTLKSVINPTGSASCQSKERVWWIKNETKYSWEWSVKKGKNVEELLEEKEEGCLVFGASGKLYATTSRRVFYFFPTLEKMIALIILLKDCFSCHRITPRHSDDWWSCLKRFL